MVPRGAGVPAGGWVALEDARPVGVSGARPSSRRLDVLVDGGPQRVLPARAVPVRAAAGTADGAGFPAVRHRVHADRRLGGGLRPGADTAGAPRAHRRSATRSGPPGRVARACAIPTGCMSRSWRTTRSRALASTPGRSACPVAVRSVTLSVPDLARSEAFFSRGLGLRALRRRAARPRARGAVGAGRRADAQQRVRRRQRPRRARAVSRSGRATAPGRLPDLGPRHPQHRLRRSEQARSPRALPSRTRGRGGGELQAGSHARRGRRLRQRPGPVLGRAAVDVAGFGQALGIHAATGRQAAAGGHARGRADGADRRARADHVGCDRGRTRRMPEWLGLGSSAGPSTAHRSRMVADPSGC